MFWKRKKKAPAVGSEKPFKERVENFWDWWTSQEERFLKEIDEGRCGDLQEEISAAVNELHPSFAWVFGPPPEGKPGHSFTLSGEGMIDFQFLAAYWKERAPEWPHWTFFASRQPGEVDPVTAIAIGENSFEFGKLWLSTTLDLERELIDVEIWHPEFEKAEEKTTGMVMFLMLDEILGEYGTDQWLGVIERGSSRLQEAIPVTELPDLIRQLEVEREWKKYPPTEQFVSYKMKETSGRFLRGDVIAGTAANMRLVREYQNAEGIFEDPLSGTGAEYVFVALDRTILPAGEEVDFRCDLEDAIDNSLRENHAGRTLGGASGTTSAYLDVLIYDRDRSMNLIEAILRERRLPEGTGIHFFASGNEGRRVFL